MTLAVAAVMSGCGAHDLSPDEQFRFLFSGYTLIRTGGVTKDTSLIDGGLGDLGDLISSNVKLTPDHAYAFRKDNDWGNETIALEVFPERLRKIGARVVKGPRSEKELLYAIMGGPYFRIEFEKDGHPGTIFNRLARDKTEGAEGSEVLVVIYR